MIALATTINTNKKEEQQQQPTSMTLEEKILETHAELKSVRRARWDDEKNFYEQTEEKRCGISILRSRLYELLNSGVDFQVFVDIMMEANNKDENLPYMSMHVGHQVLLLSTIHQMETRKNVLKETARSGKKMVQFLEEKKSIIEQETVTLAVESARKVAECDMYVLDDAMAQKVVAQRLVIRKMNAMLNSHVDDSSSSDHLSNSSGRSTASPVGRIVNVPIEDLEDIPMDGNGKSPRHVKSFMPPESLLLDEYALEELSNDNTAMNYLEAGALASRKRWGLSFRTNPQSS